MPDLFWDKIDVKHANGTDVDISEGMNIMFNPKSFKMAYPQLQFQDDSGKTKPSILVIADSYYWEMYNFGISRLFSKSHFWFYNKEIYPESFQSPLEASQINLEEEIARHDVFVIMATEATLPNFGWGFIENVYDFFKGNKAQEMADEEFHQRVNDLINYIRTDKKWMELIEKKAANNNISVDSMLKLDATWQIRQDEN
jgi:hypothetical protein